MKKGLLFSILCAYFLCLSISKSFAQTISIAIINRTDVPIYNLALKGFKDALNRNGYREGEEIGYDIYSFDKENLPALLKSKNHKLIYTIGTESTKLVKERVTDIPVVFSMVLKVTEVNSVTGTGFSGTNMTGVSLDISIRQQLEILKKIMPKMVRIGIIYNPNNSYPAVEEAKQLQEEFKVNIKTGKVNVPTEVPKILNEMGGTIDLLWLIPDVAVCTKDTLPYIINYSLNNRIPVMAFAESLVKAGALFSYVYDCEDVGRQAGELAIRILRGESPGNVAIDSPRKIGYVLNLKTAAHLGIRIPPAVVRGAVAVY